MMTAATNLTEHDLRERLGVPASADEVVIVAETTHWDPDWLLSADTYSCWFVGPTLDAVLDELDAEPRRVFSLECVFFVERYWRDRPEQRDRLRTLVNEGRLHFTGSGVTTPDTLLPEDELILRDLLVGQEWLRSHGMHQEPRLLYLPDSFGHSPGLPALLRAAGIDRAAICRIAGMRFPGADLEPAGRFPRPGTAAAELLEAGTADFVWRAPDGSEVLTHWMAHGYGHGDMIGSGGLSRALRLPTSWRDRRPRHVDRQVQRLLAELRRVARTPYLLLPIGYDFVAPVPRLVDLLDDWNDRNHDRTGTWLVNGTIDDHLDLVEQRRDVLPTIELDPNPYWSGFYASRPELKAAARDLGRRLIARDAAQVAAQLAEHDVSDMSNDGPAWWTAVTSNHHDFVTGTAPDRVVTHEQLPWLRRAIAATPWPAMTSPPTAASTRTAAPATEQLQLDRDGDHTVVSGRWGSIAFDAARGGAAVSLTDSDGSELLAGPSLTVSSYVDSGGLWRLGQEIFGGRWSLADDSSRHPATIQAVLTDDGARVEVRARCDDHDVVLTHTLRAGDATVVTDTSVHPRRRRSISLVIRPRGAASSITMHQPGGVVRRPLRRFYEPTYWPLHSSMVTDPTVGPDGRATGLAIATASPTGVHVDDDGTTEVLIARAPFKELAFGVVPVMAPAWGWRTGTQTAAFAWTLGTDRDRGRLTGLVDAAVGRPAPAWPVDLDDPDVEVVAVKRAHRGDGVIVRLRDWALASTPRRNSTGRSVHLRWSDPTRRIVRAHATDALERDRAPLNLTPDGRVEVVRSAHVVSVRVVVEPDTRYPSTASTDDSAG